MSFTLPSDAGAMFTAAMGACGCNRNHCSDPDCRASYQRDYRRQRRVSDPGFAEDERRRRRLSYHRHAEKNAEKKRARDALRNALKAGRVEQGSCEVGSGCEGRIEAHHEDYKKPLDVRWFCQRHHAEHERLARR